MRINNLLMGSAVVVAGLSVGCFLDDNPQAPPERTLTVTDTTFVADVQTEDSSWQDTTDHISVHTYDTMTVLDSLMYDDGFLIKRLSSVAYYETTIVYQSGIVETTLVDSYLTIFAVTDSSYSDAGLFASDTQVVYDTISDTIPAVIQVTAPIDTLTEETTTADSTRWFHTIIATTTAMDYSSGNIGSVSIPRNTAQKDLLSIHSDNIVRTFGGSTYILERFGRDNIIRINGMQPSAGSVAYQKTLGVGTNIQDIAFVDSTKGYVTQLGSAFLLVLNLRTGLATDSVDLSDFNTYSHTADSTPEKYPYMSPIVVHGDNVYVGCQRLKNFSPADTSCIVIISTITDSVVGSINLNNKNPVSVAVFNGFLYVSCAGNSWNSPTDGGVEKIDLTTGHNKGVLATEQQFNGDMGPIVVADSANAYAIISGAAFTSSVVPFNLQTGTPGTAIAGIDNAFGGIANAGKYLYVGDRSLTSPGVIVVNISTNSKVAGPLNVGSAPNSLAILETVE